MADPVMDDKGMTFERSAIVYWYNTHSITRPLDPQGLQQQKTKQLIPNRALREIIYQHMGAEWAQQAESSLQAIPPEYRHPPDPHHTTSNSPQQEEEPLRPREIIHQYLEEISQSVGKRHGLNDQGIHAFIYQHLTIVIEVPENTGSFFIYSNLAKEALEAHRNTLLQKVVPPELYQRVWERCLKLNYLQQETRGGCLSKDPLTQEILYSYTDRCREVNAADFRNILENFIDTSLNLDEVLVETIHDWEKAQPQESTNDDDQDQKSASEIFT